MILRFHSLHSRRIAVVGYGHAWAHTGDYDQTDQNEEEQALEHADVRKECRCHMHQNGVNERANTSKYARLWYLSIGSN